MKKQDFFQAMDKLMENTFPEHIESVLDVVEMEYLPEYKATALSKLRYCPMCFKRSKKKDFQTNREEEAYVLEDKDQKIFLKHVVIHSKCPRCGYMVNESMSEPIDADDNDQTVFCKACKEPRKLWECREEKSFIDDSGMTYYAFVRYYCPVCQKLVKDVNA